MSPSTTPDPPTGPRQGTDPAPDFRPRPGPGAAGPPPDGGYPADGDLHQMSDDGGPVGPNPARWADPVWGDNPGDPAVGEATEPGEPGSRTS